MIASTFSQIKKENPYHARDRGPAAASELNTPHRTAKTFSHIEEIEKFNPNHGSNGQFTTAGAATSFTIRTRSGLSQGAANMAIEREKERMGAIMPTEAQSKALKGIESRTRNLKNEQFRVVDREGNVVMQKQGDADSVSYKIGEARENFPGNVTIHNHPGGGTFSAADLSNIGYGATEIRAASPEGTYILRNVNPRSSKGWYDMRSDMDYASGKFKDNRQIKKDIREKYNGEHNEKIKPIIDKWDRMKKGGASQEELNEVAKEYTKRENAFRDKVESEVRTAYVNQYHKWYKSHAGEYGMEYEFIPVKGRARKAYEPMEDERIDKSQDDVILDKKMNQDVKDITHDIMNGFNAGTIPLKQYEKGANHGKS